MISRCQTTTLRTREDLMSETFPMGIIHSADYKNPPIPKGYKHIHGEWNEGLVLENSTTGSQIVWVPVLSLESDGVFGGNLFLQQFGRRNYLGHKEFHSEFTEPLSKELRKQYQSVMKNGGFFVTRYHISKNAKGKPVSVAGAMPWTDVDFNHAKKVAANLESGKAISSHLTFGSEYDSILAWFIQSGAKQIKDATSDAKTVGIETLRKSVSITGSKEECCINGIYDFGFNINEWTQERYGASKIVIRGGYLQQKRFSYPATHRYCSEPDKKWRDTGFRAVFLL